MPPARWKLSLWSSRSGTRMTWKGSSSSAGASCASWRACKCGHTSTVQVWTRTHTHRAWASGRASMKGAGGGMEVGKGSGREVG
eukprot:365549-Chlamydomonas_euryale.AAC.4